LTLNETDIGQEHAVPPDDPHAVTSDKDVTLMFSGGVDSTVTASLLAQRFKKVHLVTYSNGYAHSHFRRAEIRAKELLAVFPDKFCHSLLSIRELFEFLTVNTLEKDFREYGSGFIWCLACKIAMHTRSILYNLENGIKWMADGSSGETDEMVEQMPVSVNMIGRFYEQFGIRFHTPVYHLTRKESIAVLEKIGLKRGIRIKDRFLGIQPVCRPGLIYYLPFLLFNQAPDHQEETVARFIEHKIRLAVSWLEQKRPDSAKKEI
jgi:hypothetical protein